VTSVEIDIEKIKSAITAATGLSSSIDSQRHLVMNASPISLPTLNDTGVGRASKWIDDNIDELNTRRDLAILLDTDDTGHVTYQIPVDNLTGTKDLLGETLAERAGEVMPQRPEDYNKFSALLANWVDDPAVMESMYTTLGPDGTLAVLSTAAQDPQGYGLKHDDQQKLLDLLRDGLETATTDPTFPDTTFAQGLVDEATRDPNELYQNSDFIGYNPSGALAFLLSDGTFDRPFLETVADGLDDYERVQMDGARHLWGYRPDNGANFTNFVDWGFENLDPMTGLMSAMENDPELALDFFSDNDDPDKPGEGINSRAYYYIHERNWDQDGYQAITGVIDAAATDPANIADPESQDAQNAARLASKFVDYLSTRDNIDSIAEKITWPGNESSENVAHLLTTYMAGVDHALTPGADGDVDPGVFQLTSDAQQGVLPNMPLFDRDSLQKVALLGLVSDDGFAQMRTGLNEYRADNLGLIADQLAADPDASTMQTTLTTALGADARLEGFFVRTLQDDHIGDADAQDARTAAWIDFGSDVIDLVPVPGVDKIVDETAKNIVNAAIDRGKSSGKDAITDWLAHEGKDARADANDAAEATLNQHSYVVATLLADRGLAGNPDLDIPSWDEYSAMSDSERATVRSQLFSTMEGVGGYFNIDDYNQAYRDEFQDYFK